MKQSNLRIKRHFSIIPHSLQQVELRSGVWNPTSYVIDDESKTGKLGNILKDLDGNFTTQEIAKKHNIPRAEVEGVMDHLQQLNVLEKTSASVLDYYAEEMVAQQNTDNADIKKNILIIGDAKLSYEIQRVLSNTKNNVDTIPLDDPIISKLKENDQWLFNGLQLQEMVDDYTWWKDYFVVLALTYNDPILAMRINQINFALGIEWMMGTIDGPFLFIGPAFISKSGPCYYCLEKRVTMNLREYASYQRYKNTILSGHAHAIFSQTISPVIANLLAAHLSMEILNYQVTKTCFTKGKVLSIYLPTMEICFNEVLRLSGCHVCGSVAHRDDQQLYFDYQTLLENTSC